MDFNLCNATNYLATSLQVITGLLSVRGRIGAEMKQ